MFYLKNQEQYPYYYLQSIPSLPYLHYMKYKWLLFDLDNTLIDFKNTSHRSLVASFKEYDLAFDEEAYHTYLTVNKGIWEAFEQKKIDAVTLRRKRFSETFQALNIKGVDPAQFNKSYMQNLVSFSYAYEGVVDLLTDLKNQYTLSIITNGLKEAQRPRLNITGIVHFFDSIIVSDEIGIAKPDKGFFDYSLATINHSFNPEEIIVIGDNLGSDILGAHNAGLPSCWISHGKENKTSLKPDIVVDNVLELRDILIS